MFAPVAKWVRRIDRADRLDDYVDMAFTAATSGRPGPAVLLVPADLLTEAAAPLSSLLRPRAMSLGQMPLDRALADPAAIAAAADALAAARQPLVVAGGGIHLSGAAAELAALQEAAHLPVGTTVMGKGGVDETHPLTPRRHRLCHGAGVPHQRDAADRRPRRRRAAGRQPHQPERHGQLEAVLRRRPLHPPRHRSDGGRPQLRGACGWSATPS